MLDEQECRWEEPSWENEYPSYTCVISLNENEYYFDRGDMCKDPILVNINDPIDVLSIKELSECEREDIFIQLDSMYSELDDPASDAPYDDELEMLYQEQLYQNLMHDFINIKRYK